MVCKDINCERAGKDLRLSEFPVCRRSKTGRYLYCRSCCIRRSRALRAAKGARERRRRELGIERKPNVISPGIALEKVYEALICGCRTREEIRRQTQLDYDLIGDALTELVFDCKAVKIERRQFHIAA